MMARDYVKYQTEYIKENYRRISVKISKKQEPDLLAWVESKGNMQAYIRDLIKQDMEKHTKED